MVLLDRKVLIRAVATAAWLLTLCALGVAGAGAAVPTATADQTPLIKAAILYNICKFVDWPLGEAGADSMLELGVLGSVAEQPDFASIEGRPVRQGRLNCRCVEDLAALPSLGILFIARDEEERLEEILSGAAGAPILTVSEIEGFGARGGMVELCEEDQRVRFLINPEAAAAAGLRLSSQLLKMARLVETE